MLMNSRRIQSSFTLPDNWLEYVTTYIIKINAYRRHNKPYSMITL